MGGCFSKGRISLQGNEEKEAIDEAKRLFSYENMVKFFLEEKVNPVMVDSKEIFGASIGDSVFITFGHMSTLKEKDVGWKMHISIDDKDMTNLARAWNLLKDIFIEEKLTVKVVYPNSKFYEDERQHGKQVTMYCFMSMSKKSEEWQKIFNCMEEILLANNIINNKFPSINKVIPGSKYLSYKNDDNGMGGYVASPTSYNQSNQPDPFLQAKIELRQLSLRS
jgi:hypothetical protein